MPDYDFKQLSPHDFELLARDLIQARDQIQLETFKTGRDQGIDFRCAKGPAKLIVQCKHFATTGLNGLIRELKKEVPKAVRLSPTRYILVTSVGLTPLNKTEIQALFGDLIRSPEDVIGADDLNNLLAQHDAIHGQHYKLWLGSRAVLDRVLHNASITQSEFEAKRVYAEISRYVENAAYPRARAMLDDSHVAIISGAPGVGKTTLARILLYDFLEQGFEAVSILTDFQTGRERYQPGTKQIFYFDDFIGATFLGERASTFTRNEDRAILDFVELVRASKSARLVMTTREHILQQTIATSEKLKNSSLIDDKCVLEIGDYSELQRAEILYNHIHFSDLPGEYRDELLAGRFYREIVRHQKFTPRLIEWLSNFRRIKSVPPAQYRPFVRQLLANPADIWRHAHDEQISDSGRSILLALYAHGGKCPPVTLEAVFWSLHELRSQRYGFKTSPADWRRGLMELSGSFIRPGKSIEVIDPSVIDMLHAVVRDDPRNALDIIEGAVRFDEARRIWTIAKLGNNKRVYDYLVVEKARIISVFSRLLDAPVGKLIENGVTHHDDSAAERLAMLSNLAVQFKEASIVPDIRSGLDTLLTGWGAEHFEISEGIRLLDRIDHCDFVFGEDAAPLRARLLAETCREASYGCWSHELRELIDAINDDEITPALKGYLEKAAENFQSDRFEDELRDAKSSSDLEKLEADVVVIGERLGVHIDGMIDSLVETQMAFEKFESDHADAQHDYWKETRQSSRSADNDIDNLFDTLRRDD